MIYTQKEDNLSLKRLTCYIFFEVYVVVFSIGVVMEDQLTTFCMIVRMQKVLFMLDGILQIIGVDELCLVICVLNRSTNILNFKGTQLCCGTHCVLVKLDKNVPIFHVH